MRPTARDFASYERLTTTGGFVIEENPGGDEKSVRLAVVDGVPVRGDLAGRVRAPRIKWRELILRGWSGVS